MILPSPQKLLPIPTMKKYTLHWSSLYPSQEEPSINTFSDEKIGCQIIFFDLEQWKKKPVSLRFSQNNLSQT